MAENHQYSNGHGKPGELEQYEPEKNSLKSKEGEESEENELKLKRGATFREKWKDPIFKKKCIYSMFLALDFLVVGMYVGILGPSFLDLQIITNTDIEGGSAFFTAGSTAYLVGSIVTGLVYNKMNKPLLLFITTICLGASNIIVPHCKHYELMIMIRFCTGLFAGCIDTAINSEHMRIWGNEANSLMQFSHFCFSLGGVLSPLYTGPFLAKKQTPQENATVTTSANESLNYNATGLDSEPIETQVGYAFLITGCTCILVSIPFLVLFFKDRNSSQPKVKVEERRFSQRNVPFPLLIVLLSGICFFYFAYCCVEDTFFAFFMTFLVKEYDTVSKSQGAIATAIAWISFALSRFLMIFLTRLFTSIQLLFAIAILMAVSFASILIFAHYAMIDGLIVVAAIGAFSLSGVFPLGLLWMESEMFQVTGIISACILVSSTLGTIVNPIILGYLMEEHGNMWFCYLLLIDTLVVLSVLIILFIFSRYYIDRKYGKMTKPNLNETKESPQPNDVDDDHDEKDEDDENKVIFIQ